MLSKPTEFRARCLSAAQAAAFICLSGLNLPQKVRVSDWTSCYKHATSERFALLGGTSGHRSRVNGVNDGIIQ